MENVDDCSLSWPESGRPIWAAERFDPAKPGGVPVEVTDMPFAWYFRYPGADGKFGTSKAELMDPSAGNEAAIGLDTSDPAAKDDVVTGTMYLPVNRESDLRLRAIDVIPRLLCSVVSLQAGRGTRSYHPHALHTRRESATTKSPASELCGLGHYKMHGMVKGVGQQDFDRWMATREAEKQ